MQNTFKIHFYLFIVFLFIGQFSFSQNLTAPTRSFSNSKTMSQQWELNSNYDNGTLVITSYKPVYLMLAKWSNQVNKNPKSEQLNNGLPFDIGYKAVESKFQLSLKTKIAHHVLWGKGDIWAAYSQKAHWQIYNATISRPFRELNYEPELILNFPTDFKLFGFTAKMFGLAFNHQSNGQSEPITRSWNRIIFHLGLEKENWQIYLKPWFRIADEIDENPEIVNFSGRIQTKVIYDINRHRFTANGTHSLQFGNENRGSIELNWTFPIQGNFSGHFQIFSGFGETLIDYNHKQTTIGLGVSLMN